MEGGRNVFIAAHQPLMREGLKVLLRGLDGVRVCGEASDGRAALEGCERLGADLAVIECGLPLLDGVCVMRLLKRRHPTRRVLAIGGDDPAMLRPALEAGADGYLLPEASADEVRLAVRALLAGGGWLSPWAAREVLRDRRCAAEAEPAERKRDALALLTPREREVLHLVAEGYRNREIAGLLVVSDRTVEKHRANLFRKLSLHSQADARAWAEARGFALRPRPRGERLGLG
ncbi:MAG: response regulator transcription factor [Desulfovibrio sp.]|jgi:DNA-binding NarL/FixJ family response regulator|nr:response regulator transcription factor [Desulfovibrio sp.]